MYTDLWNTIGSGKTWRGELCNRKKNGELYWESASISPMVNTEGEIEHFVAVKEDITAHRQDQQALSEAEERSRLLLESVGEGIIGTDADPSRRPGSVHSGAQRAQTRRRSRQ